MNTDKLYFPTLDVKSLHIETISPSSCHRRYDFNYHTVDELCGLLNGLTELFWSNFEPGSRFIFNGAIDIPDKLLGDEFK